LMDCRRICSKTRQNLSCSLQEPRPMHYLLFYEKAADHAEREPAHAATHREHLHAAIARGELVLGGPLTNPDDGRNVLLFESDTAEAAETFAAADPFVQHGIVIRWQVRPWDTVVGAAAAHPLSGF
jgi:uncharacterized protein